MTRILNYSLSIVPTPSIPSNPILVQGSGAYAGMRLNTSGNEGQVVNALCVVPMIDGGTGFVLPQQGMPDDAVLDDQLATSDFIRTGTVARLTGLNDATGQWWRLRVAATDQPTIAAVAQGAMLAAACGYIVDGDGVWRRHLAAASQVLAGGSTAGAALVASAGEFTAEDAPAAATVASVTVPAGGAGVRHTLRSLSVALAAVANQGPLEFVVRNGAAGVGAVIWRTTLMALAGTGDKLAVSGLNIVGSPNTALTIECTAAPAATNLARVAMSYNTTST